MMCLPLTPDQTAHNPGRLSDTPAILQTPPGGIPAWPPQRKSLPQAALQGQTRRPGPHAGVGASFTDQMVRGASRGHSGQLCSVFTQVSQDPASDWQGEPKGGQEMEGQESLRREAQLSCPTQSS